MNKLTVESVRSARYPGRTALYRELPDGIISTVRFHVVPEHIGRISGKLDTVLNIVSIEAASGKTFFRYITDYDVSWVLFEP